MEEIEIESWETKFKPINGAFYRRFLKEELCLCGWCKFHRNDNLRKSKYLRRSWKQYRKTQYKPKEVKFYGFEFE